MFPNTTALRRDVQRRLRRGENMVLYGPHGIGKTTLLLDLEARMRAAGIRCARAPETHNLGDITRALEAAYPAADTAEAPRLTASGTRLWDAAELKGGVLLLDHLTNVSKPTVGFLRWLGGGIMGVMSAVDVELGCAHRGLRPWRVGTLAIRMPGASADVLYALLHKRAAELDLPELDADTERLLIRAAGGRPGWILQCTLLQTEARYWQGTRLFASVLCADTDAALRQDSCERLTTQDPDASDGAADG